MSDIKLPPLPQPTIFDGVAFGGKEPVSHGYSGSQIHEYSRQCVLADRAARADAWQPIATAQKDGTEIWAFNGEQARMKWSEGPEWALWIWSDETLNDVDPSPDSPTHWMPLPDAPTQERGADDDGG